MSDFMEALVDLLPSHNSLKNPNNELRRVLDGTVGAWFDNYDIQSVYDNLFLGTASEGYLDLFGADYGVYRRVGESDEDYRNRIIMEKLEYLTPGYLRSIFGLTLYAYISQFDATSNTLTSDNPYLSNQYMSIADGDLQNTLNKKFILDNSILWLNNDKVDYIIKLDGFNGILEHMSIYNQTYLNWYFSGSNSVSDVRLNLFKVVDGSAMFLNSVVENVFLNAPNLTDAIEMFRACPKLVNVELNLPVLENGAEIFQNCNKLETINVNLPVGKVNGFKNYVLNLNLENLISLVINGVEYL